MPSAPTSPRSIDGARAVLPACALLFVALACAHAFHARALALFAARPIGLPWAAAETGVAWGVYGLELLAGLFSLVALSRWAAAVHRFATSRAPAFAHSSHGAVFSWWIPFVGAVIPYWVLRDAYEVIDPSSLPEPTIKPREDPLVGYRSPLVESAGARIEASPPPLRAFWACWVLSIVLTRAAEAYGLRFGDPAHIARAFGLRSVAALVTAVALLLAWRAAVAFDLAARERVRREEGLAP